MGEKAGGLVVRGGSWPMWCWTSLMLLCGGCASTPATAPVSVEQIVQMSKDGNDGPSIVAKMRQAGTIYRLSGSKLAALKLDGVPDQVLDYMLQTYLRAERERQVEECALGPPYFPVE